MSKKYRDRIQKHSHKKGKRMQEIKLLKITYYQFLFLIEHHVLNILREGLSAKTNFAAIQS